MLERRRPSRGRSPRSTSSHRSRSSSAMPAHPGTIPAAATSTSIRLEPRERRAHRAFVAHVDADRSPAVAERRRAAAAGRARRPWRPPRQSARRSPRRGRVAPPVTTADFPASRLTRPPPASSASSCARVAAGPVDVHDHLVHARLGERGQLRRELGAPAGRLDDPQDDREPAVPPGRAGRLDRVALAPGSRRDRARRATAGPSHPSPIAPARRSAGFECPPTSNGTWCAGVGRHSTSRGKACSAGRRRPRGAPRPARAQQRHPLLEPGAARLERAPRARRTPPPASRRRRRAQPPAARDVERRGCFASPPGAGSGSTSTAAPERGALRRRGDQRRAR